MSSHRKQGRQKCCERPLKDRKEGSLWKNYYLFSSFLGKLLEIVFSVVVLDITSGWVGITITKFFSVILLDYQTRMTLSLEQLWDRSGVVSEHVVDPQPFKVWRYRR